MYALPYNYLDKLCFHRLANWQLGVCPTLQRRFIICAGYQVEVLLLNCLANLPFDCLAFRPIGHFNVWPLGRLPVRQFVRLDGLPLNSFVNWPFNSLAAWPFCCYEFVARLPLSVATWSLCYLAA